MTERSVSPALRTGAPEVEDVTRPPVPPTVPVAPDLMVRPDEAPVGVTLTDPYAGRRSTTPGGPRSNTTPVQSPRDP